MDQAAGLRQWKEESARQKTPDTREIPMRITAVTGGKGGVGKSNIALNLALALKKSGKRVCLMDADLGLSSIDVLLGIKPRFNLGHVLTGQKTMKEILVEGPFGLSLIPAASGLKHLAELGEEKLMYFVEEASSLADQFDHLIIDTPAGISRGVLTFLLMSSEVIVVATPEPTSLTDSYAVIKSLKLEGGKAKVMFLFNMCRNEEEGIRVGEKLKEICRHFMGMTPEIIGVVSYDPSVPLAVRKQRAFLDLYPASKASQQITDAASRLVLTESKPNDLGDFFSAMKDLFS